MEYFNHKFRATIGKNRLFDPFERVVFAYSGSASSVAMLHLIKQVIILT
jgi:tRNA(Ile)-lysidine synthase TilS/MesJ